MKFMLFFIFTLTHHFASASLLDGLECRPEIEAHAENVSPLNEWRVLSNSNQRKIIASPTDQIGVWIQIVISKTAATNKIKFLTPLSTITYEVLEDCEIIETHTRFENTPGNTLGLSYFNDSDLLSLIKRNHYGVIYMWSPRFVYSVSYLQDTRVFVENMGIPFTSVMRSTRSDLSAVEGNYDYLISVTNEEIVLSASLELQMRGLSLHSPSFLLYKDGKIIHDIIVGVHTNRSLYRQLRGLK